MDKLKNTQKIQSHNSLQVDVSVLGQIMAAQNILFVLPAEKNITEFFAKSLFTIPGVAACRVRIGNYFSQEGTMNSKACSDCENNKMIDEENHIIPKSFVCKLMELPNAYVFTLETIDYRFGFFIFSIEQPDLFELYKPFINNLGNFIALSLENRLHKSNLQNAQNILENRVKERTGELQAVNKQLEEEIEVRKRAEDELQKLNEDLEHRVKERTMELEKKNRDLEKMNKLFVGRELSMIDLKKKIANLEKIMNNRAVT